MASALSCGGWWGEACNSLLGALSRELVVRVSMGYAASVQRFGMELRKVCWIRIREPRPCFLKTAPNVIAPRATSSFGPAPAFTSPLPSPIAHLPGRPPQSQRVVSTADASIRNYGIYSLQHVNMTGLLPIQACIRLCKANFSPHPQSLPCSIAWGNDIGIHPKASG